MSSIDKLSDFNKKEIKEHEAEFRKASNYSNDKKMVSFAFGFYTGLFTKDSYRMKVKHCYRFLRINRRVIIKSKFMMS